MREGILWLIGALTIAMIIVVAFAVTDAEAQERVTLCHRTGSATNPYVQITLSAAGAFHGHLDHEQVGNGLGGDIIPPFTYQGETYSKNWTAEGRAIWENGCVVPDEVDEPNGTNGTNGNPPSIRTITAPSDRTLAFTGARETWLVLGAVVLLLLGAGFLRAGYRRRDA
jgi:hypothetical protein